MRYTKPNLFIYRLAQVISWFVATFIFRRKILRNEIRGKQGAYVVIANHQAVYDFVNLIGLTCRPMTFVISSSFYNSLPIKGLLDKMGVIPKQQFQTSVRDMKKMKSVIAKEQPLVIYPAGLMCEDGLSTPIPAATYKFLKWLGTDVYVARASGTYFAMPKWSKGMRPGRTYMDVYKLFSKEELETLDVEQIREKTDEALLFDAYREQENSPVRYFKNDDLNGLENVLYVCPHCGAEHTITVEDNNTLHCTACGFAEQGDEYGFLHKISDVGEEIRYVSDWSKLIYNNAKEQLRNEPEASLSANCTFRMVSHQQNKFVDVGKGSIHLSRECFHICGSIDGEEVNFTVPVGGIPTLPFSPGKYLEIQHGSDIYRCVLHDGKLVMKFINMVKIFFELKSEALTV